jgi:peptide/nickel transport system substrate-binding protein
MHGRVGPRWGARFEGEGNICSAVAADQPSRATGPSVTQSRIDSLARDGAANATAADMRSIAEIRAAFRRRSAGRTGWRTTAEAALAAAVAILGFACGGAERTAAEGEIVVVAIPIDVDAFNPLITTTYYGQEIDNHALFTPLIQYNEGLEPTPWLAQSWVMEGDTAVVFELRQDVRWHDGQPVTVEDVKFTFDRAKDPDVASPILGSVFLKDVASAEVVGPNSIRFTFARPHAQALEDFWWAPVPRHVLESVPVAELRTAPFNRSPIGSGPFRLEEWIPNDRVVLVRNPDFPAGLGGPAASERVVMRVITESTTALAELTTGGAHVNVQVLPEQASQVEGGSDTRLFAYPGRTVFYIGWNNARAPFDDVQVRRALASAVDRQGIIAGLLHGRARPATSTTTPGHPLSPDELPLPTVDVAGARAALEAAGWADANGDGIREKDGRPLAFSLLTSTDAIRMNVAQALQSQLREVGADVEIRALEFQTMLQLHRDRDFDAVLTTWSLDNFQLAGAPSALLHSSQADVPRSPNRSSVRDPVLDSLIDRGAQPLPQPELGAVWRAVTLRLQETEPITFLFWTDELVGVRTELQGVEMDVRGEFRTIARWRVGP